MVIDGNSPASHLIQEANNGKGKSNIFVNIDVEILKDKASYLEGYVYEFMPNSNIASDILKVDKSLLL